MKVYFDEVGEYHLDHVTKLLAGIPDGAFRAVGSAIKRAAQHGLTVGMKIVADEYAIGSDELKRNTQNINTIVRDGANSFLVTFGYRGNVIPLVRFDTHISNDGHISTRVLRGSARELLDNAFVAKMGSHTGIYERLTDDRFPVEELYGPSAVQAFYDRESTVDKMNEEINKTYEIRIDHEIDRVLNGWGAR